MKICTNLSLRQKQRLSTDTFCRRHWYKFLNMRSTFLKITPGLSFVFILICLQPTTVYAQSGLQRYTYTHPQMGTVFTLIFYTEKDSAAASAIATNVFARVDTLNAIFSDYIPDSELNRLSDKAGTGDKVKISNELWNIMRLANKYSKASSGNFDITVGAITRLWRKARHMQEMPDSARLQSALSTVGFQSIKFYKRHRVELLRKGTRLDLGGIAQGYAADECLHVLKKSGINIALADAGGDIALADAPPGTNGWSIERAVDRAGKTDTEIMYLSNCGITTSGAKYRFFEHNGIRYSHIVNPRTSLGMTHRNLVTVKAPNAVIADAWATALSVMSEADWLHLRPKHRELTVWIATLTL